MANSVLWGLLLFSALQAARPAATVFSREGDDWVGHALPGDVDLALPEIGITLPMAELYEGVEFPLKTEKDERS